MLPDTAIITNTRSVAGIADCQGAQSVPAEWVVYPHLFVRATYSPKRLKVEEKQETVDKCFFLQPSPGPTPVNPCYKRETEAPEGLTYLDRAVCGQQECVPPNRGVGPGPVAVPLARELHRHALKGTGVR